MPLEAPHRGASCLAAGTLRGLLDLGRLRGARTERALQVLLDGEAYAEIYCLYRVFDFRDRSRLFDLLGAISASCDLEAAFYLARVAG